MEIFTNTEFPAFLATSDIPYYAAYHVAESIAELFVKESGESQDSVTNVKQIILRAASSLMTQFSENH